MGILKNIFDRKSDNKMFEECYNMSSEEMLSLSDSRLADVIGMRIEQEEELFYENEQNEGRAFMSVLTEAQYIFAAVSAFAMEINGGGLSQFFTGGNYRFAPFVSEGLKEIGAVEIKKLFDDAMEKRGIDVEAVIDGARADEEAYLEMIRQYDFEDFDEAVSRSKEKESLEKLLIEYSRKNIEML